MRPHSLLEQLEERINVQRKEDWLKNYLDKDETLVKNNNKKKPSHKRTPAERFAAEAWGPQEVRAHRGAAAPAADQGWRDSRTGPQEQTRGRGLRGALGSHGHAESGRAVRSGPWGHRKTGVCGCGAEKAVPATRGRRGSHSGAARVCPRSWAGQPHAATGRDPGVRP